MKYMMLVASTLVLVTSAADAQRRVAPRRATPVVTRPSDPTAYPWNLGNCVRVHFPQCSGGMDGGGF